MAHKEQARAASLRGYVSIADYYKRYWLVNGKPPPPLRKYELELLDALEAASKNPLSNNSPLTPWKSVPKMLLKYPTGIK